MCCKVRERHSKSCPELTGGRAASGHGCRLHLGECMLCALQCWTVNQLSEALASRLLP